jgi:hypothetical protein
MSKSTISKSNLAGTSKTRVQGVSTEQTVKSSAGILHRIVLSNGGASARTLTVTDGSTVQTVLQLPASVTVSIPFEVAFATSIKVTPSHADVDALVIYS